MTVFKYSDSNSIRDAVKELNKSVQELSGRELDILYNEIRDKYTGDLNYPLWERIEGSIFVRDEKGWISIRSLISGKETLLFLDPKDEFAIKVQDGEDLVEILDACGYITFYITTPSFDFLLAYNDHDALMVKGEIAEKWMKKTYSNSK